MITYAFVLLLPFSPGAQTDAEKPSLPPEVQMILVNCDELGLLSLDLPRKVSTGKKKPDKDSEYFHDYGIVGKAVVRDPNDRKRVVTAIQEAVQTAFDDEFLCFLPHHGIRARKGKEIVDLVICFTCVRMYMYTSRCQTFYLISDRYQFGRELDVVPHDLACRWNGLRPLTTSMHDDWDRSTRSGAIC